MKFTAESLVCDQQIQRVDAIAIVSGDRRYDFAARAVADGRAKHILLFEDRFQWAVHFGAVPPEHELAHQQLVARHLHTGQIELLASPTNSLWDKAARLASWLDEHSDSSVALICDRFQSRKVRLVLDRVLPVAASARVKVIGLPDRRCDETNWWKTRIGVKSLFTPMLSLLHGYCMGMQPPATDSSWDPVEYERQLSREVR